jgi:type IV pilus biogenesis protein CpaD/CtpE
MQKHLLSLLAASFLLTACFPLPYTGKPNYQIRVEEDPVTKTLKAVPPTCPSWDYNMPGFMDQEPYAQQGCANARNLATMIDEPRDLLEGRRTGGADGDITALGLERYRTGKTKGLIDPYKKEVTSGD